MPPKKADQPKKKKATVDDKVRGELRIFVVWTRLLTTISTDLWHEKRTSLRPIPFSSPLEVNKINN